MVDVTSHSCWRTVQILVSIYITTERVRRIFNEIHSRYPAENPGRRGDPGEAGCQGVGVHACILTGGLYELGVGIIRDEWNR